LVVIVIGWYLLSLLSFVVPAPVETVRVLFGNLGTESFLDAVGKTATDTFIAFAMSVVVGVLVGAVIGLWRPVGRIVEPALLMLNGIPKIALYPVLLLVFGLGSASQIAMGFTFGVFPVIINFAGGLSTVPPIYRRLARALAMNKRTQLMKVDIPAALPSLAVGLRLAFSLSLVGVVFSEIIASKAGLGQVIIAKYTLAQYELMGAAVLLLVATSLIGTALLWTLERRLARRWR
jgi:NitT/TauT family transport system permease protein